MKKIFILAFLLLAAASSLGQDNTDRKPPAARPRDLTTPELRSAKDGSDQDKDKNRNSGDSTEDKQQKKVRPTGTRQESRSDLWENSSSEETEPVSEPPTEFEDLVRKSLGKPLPVFGRDLFERSPSTFAPVNHAAVGADYVIGPGDELLVRAWGQVDVDLRLTVDRSGLVHLPKVGDINVAGIRYEQLPGFLRTAVGRVYRNFDLTVTLGELRTVQVFVVGHARRPGGYTVSSLSTLVNAIFASGGPSSSGSMRSIQLRRGSSIVTELDLYDLVLHGDKSHDVQLRSGDVIYVAPAGAMVAVSGSVQRPAIYEAKRDEDVATLLSFAGGLTPTANSGRVVIERITEGKFRRALELDRPKGLSQTVSNGDLIRIGPISPRFDETVTLRGSVSEVGRYQYRPGMKVRDLIPDPKLLLTPDYWENQNDLAKRDPNTVLKGETALQGEVEKTSSDINWEYALIQRMQPDLSTDLISFNLARALSNPSSPDNLSLEPGDVVTIFSQSEIAVPENRQSRLVRLEGEIAAAGVYRVAPGETLRQLLRRAGSPTSQAYLFAAQFTRESVRKQQEERYKKYLDDLEQQINRASTTTAQNKEEAEQKAAELERQRRLVQQMRNLKPTGRVVLGIRPEDASVDAFPDIALEDGDRLFIPTQPSTVSVMGAVYNESTFLHATGEHLNWYLDRAGGGTREADNDRTFILRADGSIVSKTMSTASWKSKFRTVLPGDTIVVPIRLERGNIMRNIKDWTQVLSQFALSAAAINILSQ